MWTINDFFDNNIRKFESKEALVHGEERLTWQQLGERVNRRAAWLQRQGVRKGDKVALQGRNSTSWVEFFFAIVRCGGVVVPVNHKLAATEVEYILRDSGSMLWFVDSSIFTELELSPERAGVSVFALDEDSSDSTIEPAGYGKQGAFIPVDVSENDLAELLYTSGTTGQPKGCMHSHKTILLAALSTSVVGWGFNIQDRVLIGMPIWHSAPLNCQLIGALYVGATLVLLREYGPRKFLETIQEEQCTVFFGAPIAFILPVQTLDDFDSFDISSMRAWLFGGGPIDSSTSNMLREKFKSDRFYQVYGMTESGPTGISLYPHEQIMKAGSIGKYALTGCDLRVVRTDGKNANPGDVGEIWLRAQSMMLGYHNQPNATMQAFDNGWYRTGDLARMDEDGYLFIVDRTKDMIITGGENVYSKEVEDVLVNCPGVSEVAVIGIPHADWGETVAAIVVSQDNQELDIENVKGFCQGKLAPYKIPRLIQFVDNIPRTPTGKMMKYKIREKFNQIN
ncbi:long-chain-fatty-acid--CoA ligase [Marinobacter sp. 1-3A]|uniref:class I adenylate-forming enzyme family protein n=1 Tax=Marinobacter sp. 1-3A TaxID=2582920 RepID=UPI001905093B|nr:long-chain-fatty-acid--CoA ligase [Marinobacter sp. 1-3A]MBK1875126.1 long-chain-fatty-acid--CoA ligase [Marinobacter sp. 1-3A]